MSVWKKLSCLRNVSRFRHPYYSPHFSYQKRNYVLDMSKEPFQPRVGRHPVECDTALEAIECVRSDMRLYIHGMCATPEILINALCIHCEENNLSNIELVHLLTAGMAPQVSSRYKKHFTDSSLFVSNNVRNAVNSGYAEYIPIFLSEIPLLFLSNEYKIDAALLQVSPPDNAGFCSLGCSVDISRAAAAGSNLIIGVINKYMPRTHGDGHIHISQFDYICEHNTKLSNMSDIIIHPSEISRYSKIGEIITNNLIEDGATLQLGIGAIPQQILKNLKNHRDLGIHTEMFGNEIIELFETGVITNSKKLEHPGKTIASFVTGNNDTHLTENGSNNNKLNIYDWIDDNPSIYMGETNYVNDISVISTNPNVTAVNSAIEIDLTGQVVADSIGLNVFSGVGGQLDFLRGSALSENGKPIVCLSSTTTKGESKIVPIIKKGSGIVTTRAHVRYVVTEYGYVNLFGKNLKERANLLISIAHPKDRQWLYDAAVKRFKNDINPDHVPPM